MEYLRYISEFTANPWVDIVMFIVGTLFISVVFFLVQITSAGMFSSKVTDISILGFKHHRKNDGKWEYRGHHIKLGFSANTVVDFNKRPGIDSNKLMSLEKSHMLFTGITTLVIGIAVSAGCIIGSFNMYYFIPARLVFLSGFWILLFAVGRMVIVISTISKLFSKNSLGGYCTAAIGRIRAGVPFEQLDLKSVGELNFKKTSDIARKMYFPIYFSYLDAKGLYNRMPEAVADVERTVIKTEKHEIAIAVYMTLIYYYSYHNVAPSKAKEYYHILGDDILKDTDSNSMRIKGFYELNCFGDVKKAKMYAAKAIEGINGFSVPSEREYEKSCIAKLNNAINNFQY